MRITILKIRRKAWIQIVCSVLFVWHATVEGQAQAPFVDATQEAGIDHQFKVYEGMFGGGICVFDLNKDGFEDVYMTSGMNEDVLYLNNGNGTFKNIYEGSGLEETRHYVTQGVVGADVNRDGWVDLFITTITSKDSVKVIPREKNLLFLNNGDGTFRDATKAYGLEKLNSFSTGGSFGDFNADGYPDLYVGNYFKAYTGQLREINDATIVNANQTSMGYLLLNRKGKRFMDVYGDYGLKHRGYGFGGVFTDYDNDGDQDLIINHDFGYKAKPNYFLENDYPKKQFTEISKDIDMDLKINAMGTAVGDYDNNGFMDYFVTNIRFNWFMVNQGQGKPFINRAKELGMSYVTISWGANFADFDHDGDVDLFVANGDLNPNNVPMADYYFENEDGKFTEKGGEMGVNDYGIGRGSVVFDIENDGDLDILIVNQEPVLEGYPVASRSTLYRNETAAQGNWVKVVLQGVEAESHGIGSRVEVVCGDLRMIREIDGGSSSHLSQNSTIAHFGLGNTSQIDSIIVKWTGGKRQVLENQRPNQLITIKENNNREKAGYNWTYILLLLLAPLALIIFQNLKK